MGTRLKTYILRINHDQILIWSSATRVRVIDRIPLLQLVKRSAHVFMRLNENVYKLYLLATCEPNSKISQYLTYKRIHTLHQQHNEYVYV